MSNTKHPSNLDRLADSPGGRERLADIDPRPNAVTLTWTRKTWERRRLHTGEHAAAHPVAPRKLRAYVDGNVHAASWDVAIGRMESSGSSGPLRSRCMMTALSRI